MAKDDDMFDHIYHNTSWMKKNTYREENLADLGSSREKGHYYIYIRALSVLLFLSLLANAVLGCLYFIKDPNILHCKPIRNCTNAGNPRITCNYEEKWESLNYCPDLPEQWLKGKGSFYVFSSYNKTWSSSRQHCQSLGGDLVIINNTDKKEFLAQRLCITGESNPYWTRTSERKWDNQKQGNCTVLKGDTQGDISCQREERSICEIPCH